MWAVTEAQLLPLAYRRWFHQVWEGSWQTWVHPTMEQPLAAWAVSGQKVVPAELSLGFLLERITLCSYSPWLSGSSQLPSDSGKSAESSSWEDKVKPQRQEWDTGVKSKWISKALRGNSALITSTLLFSTNVWAYFSHTVTLVVLSYDEKRLGPSPSTNFQIINTWHQSST